MAITGEVIIKVTPTDLKNKSANVTAGINKMQMCFENLETTIAKTKNYWIGEAGDLHREMYDKQKEMIETMLRRLKEHPTDLLTMAGVYENVEREVTSIANELRGDVIE